MNERELMILNRLRQLWVMIQNAYPTKIVATGPDAPSVEVQQALRANARKAALDEFPPLFNELMGGERVTAVNTGPINWKD